MAGPLPAHGQAGLAERSSRPRHCPHALPAVQVRRVLRARRRHRQGCSRTAPATAVSLSGLKTL
ncbi:MAG TPA: leucine zipper domain-containing protein [Actinomycetes bacterium]|nr:leucine zipper domain-containing protein [Actinomycetes bacterium]